MNHERRLPLQDETLATLLDGSREAMVVYNRAFRFLYVNAEAERLMGARRENLLGQSLWELFPQQAAPFRDSLTRAMEERIPLTFEMEHAPTGRWTEGRCLPVEESDSDAALAVFFRDVTDQHEAETTRLRMAFLAEASAIISSSLDLQATLESMAHIVVPRLCDWCAVQMPEATGEFIRQVAVAHVDPAKVQWARDLNQRYPTRADDPQGVAQVLRTGQAVFMPDIPEEVLAAGAKDEEHLRIILGLGFRSAIAVPLIARDRTLGVLLMVTTDESGRRLDENDLTFAEELARRAAVAVDNARLFRQARQDEERFRALVEASSQMMWRTGADGLIVDMPEWRAYTGQTEEEVRGYGWAEAIHPEDRANVEQAWLEAFSARAVYECEYRVRGRDGVYRWFFARGVPLLQEDGSLREYIGSWTSTDAQRRAEEERETLHAETLRRAERESLLNRIGEAVRALSLPEEILGAAVRELGQAMGVDRCYFAEYDVPRDWARIGADWHRPDLPSLSGSYRLSTLGMDAEEMFRGPKGILQANDLFVADSLFSPRAVQVLTGLGVRSILGVALFEGGRPVAALMVAMAEGPRTWDQEEVELVRAVATLMRSAMEDARLRKREHDIAERLQKALQPTLPGNLPGLKPYAYYQPALAEASIGGDFYDVFSVEKGCFALVVADLSGKGLQAASQVATVRHMLRTLLYQRGTTVAQAVGMLNEILSEHMLLEGFATLFVGAYDVNARSLTFVNAGQEPGLILRKATGAVEELGPTGPVLGAFPGARFSQETVFLSPGDVLALFTDGLTEAGPNRKNLLGVPGIISVFRNSVDTEAAPSAQEITKRMMAGVEDAATQSGIRDDVCLLVACIE